VDKTGTIHSFREKSNSDGGTINGGFMVFQPQVFNLLPNDATILERTPFETLAELGEMKGFHHAGFWHCMDTQRDKHNLESLWASGDAPWKIW
jgi:glucose-1-phosphate cytidylyltransferase